MSHINGILLLKDFTPIFIAKTFTLKWRNQHKSNRDLARLSIIYLLLLNLCSI